MGGDAAVYVAKARQVLSNHFSWRAALDLLRSWYPLSDILFMPMAWWPTDWMHRFIIWASLGQIMSGLALALLLRRLAGGWAAAAGVAIWAITPIVATRHFEDGTIAQLWSYSFLFIFLERFLADRPLTSSLFFMATIVSHALTGMALSVAVMAAIVPLWLHRRFINAQSKKRLTTFIGLSLGIILLGTAVLITRYRILLLFKPDSNITSPFDHWPTLFGVMMILSPLGLLRLISLTKNQGHHLIMMVAVIMSFLLFSGSHILGINIWTHRLDPLFVIIVAMTAAMAWERITAVLFKYANVRLIVHVVFFLSLAAAAWQHNAAVYAYYESPSRYARLHPDELAAILWLRDNLPSNSLVITSNLNRHSEWIPALTDLVWQAQSDGAPGLLTCVSPEQAASNDAKRPTYFVYFLNRESVPEKITKLCPEVYRNNGAVVIKVS